MKDLRVNQGIRFFFKPRDSEIRVKRIRVNRGVGVIETFLRQVIEMQGKEKN